jgi:hypothetical protein
MVPLQPALCFLSTAVGGETFIHSSLASFIHSFIHSSINYIIIMLVSAQGSLLQSANDFPPIALHLIHLLNIELIHSLTQSTH